MLLSEERIQIVECGKKVVKSGLVLGTSGNLSIYNRVKNLIAITPGSRDYNKLTPEDIIVVDLEGRKLEGKGSVSSELKLHTIFYKNRDDISAVIHTHSFHATSLSCMGIGLPAIHYMIACAGGDVRCAPYATFGTSELAEKTLKGMNNRKCVLLAQHGLVSGAKTLGNAYNIAANIESIAGLYLNCLATGGEVLLIPDSNMELLKPAFESYQ